MYVAGITADAAGSGTNTALSEYAKQYDCSEREAIQGLLQTSEVCDRNQLFLSLPYNLSFKNHNLILIITL